MTVILREQECSLIQFAIHAPQFVLAHVGGGATERRGSIVHISCLYLVSSPPKLLLPQSCQLCAVDLSRDSFPSIYLGNVRPYLDLATPSS